MANDYMKAEPGDFIKKDVQIVEVVDVNTETREYTLHDGGVISDDEVTFEMVLLPSETT